MDTRRRDAAIEEMARHIAKVITIGLELTRSPAPAEPTPPDPHPRGGLLNIHELAEMLGVPVKTIYSWRGYREPYGPPALRIGRYLRWRPEDVERWIDQTKDE